MKQVFIWGAVLELLCYIAVKLTHPSPLSTAAQIVGVLTVLVLAMTVLVSERKLDPSIGDQARELQNREAEAAYRRKQRNKT